MQFPLTVKTERDESERRPPDRNNLAEIFACHEGQEARKAHQPVGANAAEEDLVPLGSDCLCMREADGLILESCGVENTTISYDDGYDEK